MILYQEKQTINIYIKKGVEEYERCFYFDYLE